MRKILVLASVMMLGASGAWALGADTNYDTDVTNSVTLSYTVGGNAQTNITANDGAGFKVDRKVDVLVATSDGTNVIVNPGDNIAPQDNNKYLTFTVKNETNGNQDFKLSLENLSTGTATLDAGETDDIDFSTDLKVCTDNTCSGGDISGTNISFTEDEIKTYYVFADIPVGTADNRRASIALIATAVDDGTTNTMSDDSGSADNITGVDIVFADGDGVATGHGANSGKHSALSAYEVQAAVLSATKTSCVVSDPVNGTSNPKRIPGAVIRYEIEVTNSGSADANVTISDNVPAGLDSSTTANLDIRTAACKGIDGTTHACADHTGDPQETNARTAGAGTGNITLDYDNVAAGATECGYFDVTIQN